MPHHSSKKTSHSSRTGQKSAHSSSSDAPQLPDSIRSDPSLIHLDGRTLEGGGQLVRVALTLSALTSIPIHIHNIRGNRAGRFSAKGGGLKSSHLAALEFLARSAAAKSLGAFVGSSEIVFEPGRDEQTLRDRIQGSDVRASAGDVHEIPLDKPGSVWLILQAILPYILFAASEHVPQHLLIRGGTNVPKSMSAEYVTQVMSPMFEKIGLPPIEVDIRRRGWTHGRTIQIGEVGIKVHPLKRTAKLPAFELQERGSITKIAISILAGSEAMRSALLEQATAHILAQYPHLPPPEIAVNEDSGDPKRLYLLLVAHTSNGHRLGRDWLHDEKIKGTPNESQTAFIASKMAHRVIDELATEIAHGGCVDEHMRDQLVIFQTLAAGRSHISGGADTGEGSLHTQTCRWVVEQILLGHVHFDSASSWCAGLGFSAGEIYGERKREGERDQSVSIDDSSEEKVQETRLRRDVPSELADQLENLELTSR
jgi:RNA 3'-terminal phosphate cyclase (ATP)